MNAFPFQAVDGYGVAKSALQAAPAKSSAPDLAFDAIQKLAGVIETSEKASVALMNGGADPHSVIEAIAAAELAIETAVTVRDKVVEAYQELLRMPV